MIDDSRGSGRFTSQMSSPATVAPVEGTTGAPAPVQLRSAGEPQRGGHRNYGLDVLRVLSIVGVIAIHSFGRIAHDHTLTHTAKWWLLKPIHLVSLAAVPSFVVLSGALLLAPSAHAQGPGSFYKKRFLRILPAMLFWHVFYIFVARGLVDGEHLTLRELTRNFIEGHFYTALYFLWLIAGLYIVAPLFAAFFKEGGPRRAWITAFVVMGWTIAMFMTPGVASLIDDPKSLYLGSLNMWWPYLGYFLLGWALRGVVLSRRGVVVALAVAVACFLELFWQDVAVDGGLLSAVNPIGDDGLVLTIAVCCLFLAVWSVGTRWRPSDATGKVLSRLSGAAFGVFLIHLFLLDVLGRVFPAVRQATSLPVVAGTFVVLVAGAYALSLGLSKVPYLRNLV